VKQLDDWEPDELEAVADLRDQLDALRARHAGDPPLALLRAARGEALPEPLQASVHQQLSNGKWNQALVDGANAVELQVTQEDEQRILDRIHRQTAKTRSPLSWRLWIPVLGTIAAAVLVVVVLRRSDLVNQSIEPPASAPPPTTSTPAPAPSFVLALAKPDVKISPDTLIYRGATNEQTFLADLKPALDAFRESDYARANREFSALAPRYPKSVEVAFYQGVARIYLNDLAGAETSLIAAEQLNDASFGFEVQWYRAIVDERAGRAASARTRLDTLCKDGSFVRQAQACDAANRLR
jgi:hypothetical protein